MSKAKEFLSLVEKQIDIDLDRESYTVDFKKAREVLISYLTSGKKDVDDKMKSKIMSMSPDEVASSIMLHNDEADLNASDFKKAKVKLTKVDI